MRVRATADERRRRGAVVPELLFAFEGCSDVRFTYILEGSSGARVTYVLKGSNGARFTYIL